MHPTWCRNQQLLQQPLPHVDQPTDEQLAWHHD
jgi:hypothetical protein